MIRLFQLLFLVVIIVTAIIHAKRFAANKSTGPWFHFLWACVYFVPVAILTWHLDSWWIALAAVVERFALYNPILNKIRGEAFFYLSVNSKNPSFWDGLEMSWKKAYPFVWAASVIVLIVIQFLVP